ncbi:hypothetical protein CL656_05125 [bacterium]|nr:hypothetical protein [bacterium]|tara:strand:- start:5483 stop:6415 length:933 start_codon:yes stop_codon:yes gene_type:complete
MVKTLLVTGVSGLIGSSVAKSAKEIGLNVIGCSRGNCELLSKELGINVFKLNLNHRDISIPKVDKIVHCATANNVLSHDFHKATELTLYGTKNLLDKAIENEISDFAFLSTAQVYGTDLSGSYDEDSQFNIETEYALNHFYGEELCKLYSKTSDIKIKIIRPTGVYGVPIVSTISRETLVPTCLVLNLLKEGNIVLRSSGLQKRDFIHQQAVADLIIQSLLDNNNAKYRIINAATGSSQRILDVANDISEQYNLIYGKKSKVIIENNEPIETNHFQVLNKNYLKLTASKSYPTIRETSSELMSYYSNRYE